MTDVGMPGCRQLPQALRAEAHGRRRAWLHDARASLASSVVTEIRDLHGDCARASLVRMSRSRRTSADLVTMPTGWPARAPAPRGCRASPVLALDRLIRIGVGADRAGARLITRRRPTPSPAAPAHPASRTAWSSKSRPRRQAEIGMRRPREAVDAAVLAAAMRIDRTVGGNVRRLVAGDDPPRGIDRHRGLKRRQFFQASASRRQRQSGRSVRSGRTHWTRCRDPAAARGRWPGPQDRPPGPDNQIWAQQLGPAVLDRTASGSPAGAEGTDADGRGNTGDECRAD